MDQPRGMAVSIGDEQVWMALVRADGRLDGLRCWPRQRFSTLTDALLTFEREARVPLRGMACALSIFGVTHGEAITLARGGWAISQAGLRSIFQRDAVVVNDVAARAWAALGGQAGVPTALLPGATPPDFARAGRWAVTHIERGVGLAVIDIDGVGASRVLECEMGHCGASAATPEAAALLAALTARTGAPPPWEAALTLGWDDPVWHAPGLPAARARRAALLAEIAGRYAGEVVMAHGAWAGILLTGTRAAELAADHAGAFNHAFEHQRRFPRLMRAAPRWHLAGRDVTMAGLAVALDRHPAMSAGRPAIAAPAPRRFASA